MTPQTTPVEIAPVAVEIPVAPASAEPNAVVAAEVPQEPPVPASSIGVYILNPGLSVTNTNPDDSTVKVEIPLTVTCNITCPETGQTKQYSGTVVKYVEFCKFALADQMAANQVNSVFVEGEKKVEEPIVEEKGGNNETIKRLRELAGIPHSGNFV